MQFSNFIFYENFGKKVMAPTIATLKSLRQLQHCKTLGMLVKNTFVLVPLSLLFMMSGIFRHSML